MNYGWAVAFSCNNPVPLSKRLDFSDGDLSATLDETRLVDAEGVPGLKYSSVYSPQSLNRLLCIEPNFPVNWDLVTGTTTPVCEFCNVNDMPSASDPHDDDIFKDHDDWSNLQFFLRGRAGAALLPFEYDDTQLLDIIGQPPPVFSPVDILVKPFSGETPPINLRSQGGVPIAFLGSETFGPTSATTYSASFGVVGDEVESSHCGVEDVNSDGQGDLICHFPLQGSGIDRHTTQLYAQITSATDGSRFIGAAHIRIVP